MIRVLVADDQEMIRDGLVTLLSAAPDVEVVGEARDGRVAVQLTAELSPDVVVMDIRMPVLDGLAATAEIMGGRDTDEPGGPRVIVLTTFDLDEYVYGAMRAGASGFLLKDAPREQLVAAVRVVARGESLLATSVTRRLIEQFVRLAEEAGVTPAQLALNWVLSRGDNVHVIPGTTNPQHLADNVRAPSIEVNPSLLDEADRLINHDTVAGHRYHDAIKPTIDTEEFA